MHGTSPRQLATVEETREFGRALAAILRAGDLVVLIGALGAGKTALAQGIGAGLGIAGEVTSPTFVIARVHRPDPTRGHLPMVHVDAYRLGSIAEVDDLDLDATLEESVTVVEWGGGLVEHITDNWLAVHIDRATGTTTDETRTVTLTPHGRFCLLTAAPGLSFRLGADPGDGMGTSPMPLRDRRPDET